MTYQFLVKEFSGGKNNYIDIFICVNMPTEIDTYRERDIDKYVNLCISV